MVPKYTHLYASYICLAKGVRNLLLAIGDLLKSSMEKFRCISLFSLIINNQSLFYKLTQCYYNNQIYESKFLNDSLTDNTHAQRKPLILDTFNLEDVF